MSDLVKVRDKILRTDFYSFLQKAFRTVNPGTKFMPNWHINLIAEYLQALEKGEIKRLVINLPPRSLKSMIISAAWPAWLLGHKPESRIICASYAQSLSIKHSLDTRRIITSEWFRKLFPELQLAKSQNQKAKFMTTKQGYRIATSAGGSITGEGGNYLIIDDPHNPIHINSAGKRQKVIEWFDKTFSTRLDDKKKGVFVLLMQRLHEEDLSGHLIAKGWEHLSLPAIAEEKRSYARGKTSVNREAGEFLHSERENVEEINKAKEDLGSSGFAAQYQQSPIPMAGNLIKSGWVKRYDKAPEFGRVIQSWDTAIKINDNNDFSVCTSWGEGKDGYYLLKVFRARLEYPLLKKEIMNQAEEFGPAAILIEDKASGQSLIQDLRGEKNLPIIPIKAILSKSIRAARISCQFESGKVFLPVNADWLEIYERELFSFPISKHDDQVDSTTQFLEWLTNKPQKTAQIRAI